MSLPQRWVIVCGHALFRAAPLEETLDVYDPQNWYGVPGTQDPAAVVRLLVEHIRWGISQLEQPETLLIFSGCRSRGRFHDGSPTGILRSEAESYFDVAIRLGLPREHWNRVILEDFARNSLENILMGCAAAYEATHTLPSEVVVCSFSGKQQRFLHHIRSLGLGSLVGDGHPAAAGPIFAYHALGDEFAAGVGTAANEQETLERFRSDPLGLHQNLSAIRYDATHSSYRNPFLRPPGRYLYAATSWPQLYGQLAAAYGPDDI
ncbi:MAG: hypothetical protein R3C01_08945 [Planctomycetaceae bacterium]